MDVSRLLKQYAAGQRNFEKAVLKQVNLFQVQLPFIVLDEANLQRADLRRSNLAGASLNLADLSMADLTNANLIGADLLRAKLARANLSSALLSGADLRGANLRKSDLSHASLSSADLSGADFTGAILDHVNLDGANLRGANLSNTDLSRVEVSAKDLEGAILSLTQHVQFFGTSYQTDDNTNFLSNSPFDESTGLTGVFQSITQGISAATQEDPIAEELQTTGFIPHADLDEVSGPLSELAAATREQTATSREDDRGVEASPVVQSIEAALRRRVQSAFKHNLLKAYNYRCAITGCTIRPLLEATFIAPSDITSADHPANGLILRTDIKSLFQLNLIAIEPQSLKVFLAPNIRNSEYQYLEGKSINLPEEEEKRPDPLFLAEHWNACTWQKDIPTLPAQELITVPLSGLQNLVARTVFQINKTLKHGYQRPLQLSGKWVIGGVVCLALGGLTWWGTTHLEKLVGVESPPSIDTRTARSFRRVNLQVGPVFYQGQGLILNQKSYVPIDIAQQLGLPLKNVSAKQQVTLKGQLYIQSQTLQNKGVVLNWNESRRLLNLKSPVKLKIERINVKLNGNFYANEGITVGQIGYIPLERVKALNIQPKDIPTDALIRLNNQVFIRATQLKNFQVKLDWKAENRTITLNR